MRMRASETFQVITEDLMTDITRVTDTMQQPLTKRPRTGKGSDSQYKGEGKGYQQRWSSPGQGRRYRSSTWTIPLRRHGARGSRAHHSGRDNSRRRGLHPLRLLGNPHRPLPFHPRCLLRHCPSTPLHQSHRGTHGTRRATEVLKVLARKANSTNGGKK